MSSNIRWANKLTGEGFDLPTCVHLKSLYFVLKNRSGELSEQEIKRATKALAKVSERARKIITILYRANTKLDQHDFSIQSLIRNPEALINTIKLVFEGAYKKHLLEDEQQFIDARLCGYAGHPRQRDHKHCGQDIKSTIKAFCDLFLYRYTCCPPELPIKIEEQPEEIGLPSNSLVKDFSECALKNPDIWSFQFADYLEPNETTPGNVKRHLSEMSEGLIVSVGTERSLFDLLLAPDHCTGLVVVDLNPRVKAYNDFNLLLILLSNTPEKYVQLSKPLRIHNEISFKERIFTIHGELAKAPLPKQLKDYYQRNLFSLGVVFFLEKRLWRNPKVGGGNYLKSAVNSFETCRYDINPDQFSKIRAYALRGAIISVVGSINKLAFLNRPISVVDVSNVSDYDPINIKGIQDTTRVIWTKLLSSQKGYFFIYSSYIHGNEKIDEKDEKLLNNFFKRGIKNTAAEKQTVFEFIDSIQNVYCNELMRKNPGLNEQNMFELTFPKPLGSFYSRTTLIFLKARSKATERNTH